MVLLDSAPWTAAFSLQLQHCCEYASLFGFIFLKTYPAIHRH